MQRWDSVESRDTQVQQDCTIIFPLVLAQNSCLSSSCNTHGLESPDTTFGVRWDLSAGRVPTADATGDETELQALMGLVKPPGILLGKHWNLANSTLSLRYQGKDILCVSLMLVLAPCFSCGHSHLDVLRLPLCCQRTGHGLFAADLLFTLPVYITYRTGNKLWLQLPWNKPGVILVQPLLLFSRNSSHKWSLHLQASIKLKTEGRGLFSSKIL